MSSLSALARGLDTLSRRAAADPLSYYRPTQPQRDFLSCTAPVAMLRAGNQLGKTWAGLVDVIYRCLGSSPYQPVAPAPIEAWIICFSWEQSLSVQAKFHALVPKTALKPGVEFGIGKGYTGRVPIVRFRNGSLVRFKTTNQGSLGLASATINHVLIDEPPPPDIWGELCARVLRNRGRIRLTMTPIGRPVEWLRKLVEQGEVVDLHYSLTVENTTPIGGRPLLTQAEIDGLAARYLPQERAQRLHGDWDKGFIEGRIFEGFDVDKHVSDLPPFGEVQIGIGIDHGTDAGSQVATLTAISRTGGVEGNPRIWVLDQCISDGLTTPEQDARDIMGMLKRNGLVLESVDRWVGDRKHGGKRWGGRKSNALLQQGFERELRLPIGSLPFRVRTAWKPSGSVFEGARILHAAMLRGDFFVHSRCKGLIDDLSHWTGDDDNHKHGIDSLRYSAVELITTRLYVPQTLRMHG